METRKLELSHDEIELIQNALMYVYNKRLELLDKNRELTKEEKGAILKTANEYWDLETHIGNGSKDV